MPALEVVPAAEVALHLDSDACWCQPYRDPIEPLILVHRKSVRA